MRPYHLVPIPHRFAGMTCISAWLTGGDDACDARAEYGVVNSIPRPVGRAWGPVIGVVCERHATALVKGGQAIGPAD